MQEAIGTGSVDQAEMLGRLISRVAALEAAVAESQAVRRELHNQLVNLRGNVSHCLSPPPPFSIHPTMQKTHLPERKRLCDVSSLVGTDDQSRDVPAISVLLLWA